MASRQVIVRLARIGVAHPKERRPIRVLHFISEPRSWHFFDDQPAFLNSVGYEFVAVSSPGPLLHQFAKNNNVTACQVPIVRSIAPWRDIVSVCRLVRVLRKQRPDILHAHFSKPGIVGMIAGYLARVPVRIYHNHGMALSSARGWQKPVLWVVERTACALAHRVVYVAPSVRRDAIRLRVCHPDKAQVILSANGLDTSARFAKHIYKPDSREQLRKSWDIPPGAFVVGFVGRILKIKGIEELLRAWQLLAEHEPRLHLLFVGESDPREPISDWALALMKSEPRIHLAGFVKEPARLYLAMDAVVLPSYHEGLGYSLVEASAMELPVIGSRIPGIVDAIQDNVTGLLVETGDPEGLAEAIRRYLRDPILLRRHGTAGREYVVTNFQRSMVFDSIRRTYDELIATHCHRILKRT